MKIHNIAKSSAYPLHKVLQYPLPRMKQATNEVSEDLPLFV
jgi:hypothetical protein